MSGTAAAVPDTYDALWHGGCSGRTDDASTRRSSTRLAAAIADGRGAGCEGARGAHPLGHPTPRGSGSRRAEGAEAARARALDPSRSRRGRPPAGAAGATAPRRKVLRARPTLTGNMDVRREKRGDAFVLAWDAAAGVAKWEVRISERPDARQRLRRARDADARGKRDDARAAARRPLGCACTCSDAAATGDLLRRAVISGLTRDGWDERWQRRASAS